MPISSNRYVNITSSVGGGSAFPTKELLLRLYTTNERVPTGSVLNFSSGELSTSLIEYFGSDSAEYKQAAFYFGFISKQGTSPKNIQYARWTNVDTSSRIFGSKAAPLDELKLYNNAAFNLVIGGVRVFVTGIDFSGELTYAAMAASLQVTLKALGGPVASCTVTFDNTRNSFDFNSDLHRDGEISLEAVTPEFLESFGWGDKAVLSGGVEGSSVAEMLAHATTINNNYGTYSFTDALSLDSVLESAEFANSRNIEFMYLLPVIPSNRSAISEAISGYASCGMTLATNESLIQQYPWLLPAAVTGSLDYNKPAASANFMYQVDDRLTPTVSSDADANLNDAIKVNYYGATQEAGANVNFYQRGVLTGGPSAPKVMGIHANEQWLKAYLKSQFLNMFVAMQQVPADEVGQAIGLSYVDAGVAKALSNGTIATGKILTTTQKNYITQLSGDNEAWQSVQSRGYWYDLTINAENNQMDYLLIYSKRDSVDKVEGRHSLI